MVGTYSETQRVAEDTALQCTALRMAAGSRAPPTLRKPSIRPLRNRAEWEERLLDGRVPPPNAARRVESNTTAIKEGEEKKRGGSAMLASLLCRFRRRISARPSSPTIEAPAEGAQDKNRRIRRGHSAPHTPVIALCARCNVPAPRLAGRACGRRLATRGWRMPCPFPHALLPLSKSRPFRCCLPLMLW
ncbi:hypothetical protein BHE74_00055095 [Ensete ventricosum]|nr:hypothetical protein GW17_00037785 [Ensete ventricosum]RWW39577.1 hypothetical protein BHE74_00055095 [Ensete ventricosum]